MTQNIDAKEKEKLSNFGYADVPSILKSHLSCYANKDVFSRIFFEIKLNDDLSDRAFVPRTGARPVGMGLSRPA